MGFKIFNDWDDILKANRSRFFSGSAGDVKNDRANLGELFPSSESLYTQSNARVLIGHAPDGSFRFLSLPIQSYFIPPGDSDLGVGPGMYEQYDEVLYVGDLFYRVEVEGRPEVIDLRQDAECRSWYAQDFLPVSRGGREGRKELQAATFSLAPLAPDAGGAALAPAPLPGIPGALYVLYLKNDTAEPLRVKVRLNAGDRLLGPPEDAEPSLRRLKKPDVDVSLNTLILSRPFGSVGIHMRHGRWVSTDAPFVCERELEIPPFESVTVETSLAAGIEYRDIQPAIHALALRNALNWFDDAAAFWQSRLGELQVSSEGFRREAEWSRDFFIRSLIDNFNCIQLAPDGTMITHRQGAPSHGRRLWGIDVEPTMVSLMHICPELERQVLLYFMDRSRASNGDIEHSLPILVAPLFLARTYLDATGDVEFFKDAPAVMEALEGIMTDVLLLKHDTEALFSTKYSSDGPVGCRYDYGTNLKVWYACKSFARLHTLLGTAGKGERFAKLADDIAAAIEKHMLVDGPFGRQISGGTNLDTDSGSFYSETGYLYYDGEDTGSMLAPIYGISEHTWEPWVNYHRFARSLWCPHYDPEFETLRWFPGELSPLDGTALISRLAGSMTAAEMKEAQDVMEDLGIDKTTGSLYWWPQGPGLPKGLTRCSQGQGSWIWFYYGSWAGISVDVPARTLKVAPRGLPTKLHWRGFRSGDYCFDISWEERGDVFHLSVSNHNDEDWQVAVMPRPAGSGAFGKSEEQVKRETVTVQAGGTVTLDPQATPGSTPPQMHRKEVARFECGEFGDAEGIVFKRFGPSQLWGHWSAEKWFKPSEMPYTLRFVIINGSDEDWRNLRVSLSLPDGWQADERAPKEWDPPVNFRSGDVSLALGTLERFGLAVAPFWFKAPARFKLFSRSRAFNARPFHARSQPGPGLVLTAQGLPAEEEFGLLARLSAETVAGRHISRELAVPVRIIPCEKE